jgi:hypothetical protein
VEVLIIDLEKVSCSNIHTEGGQNLATNEVSVSTVKLLLKVDRILSPLKPSEWPTERQTVGSVVAQCNDSRFI